MNSNEIKARTIAGCNGCVAQNTRQCDTCNCNVLYTAAMQMAKWKDADLGVNDEEVRALDWTIVYLKGKLRIFSKANAEGVAYLENLLKKLKNAQK